MEKRAITLFYEKYHSGEIANPVADFMQEGRCSLLRHFMKSVRGKVLVVGCGSQDDMGIINEHCEGVGIDISAEAIKKSKAKYPRYEYFVSDATDLPFPDNNFDCVVCSEVIEHVPNDEKAFSEIRRVLKNEGSFLVTTPNWLSWYGLARKMAERLLKKPFTSGDQPVDNWSTPGSLRRKLNKYGFAIRVFRGIWYYPPAGKGSRQIPWRITLPLVMAFYPFEILFRVALPWFGHMILFKTQVIKNEQ